MGFANDGEFESDEFKLMNFNLKHIATLATVGFLNLPALIAPTSSTGVRRWVKGAVDPWFFLKFLFIFPFFDKQTVIKYKYKASGFTSLFTGQFNTLAPNIFLCLHKGLFTFIVLIGATFIPTRQMQPYC